MTKPDISFEFFPPQTLEASFRLWDTVHILAPLAPRFVSVTYGAGGTTRELTRDAVATLHKSLDLPVAAHLTCVDASRQETLEIADLGGRTLALQELLPNSTGYEELKIEGLTTRGQHHRKERFRSKSTTSATAEGLPSAP